MTKRFFVFTLFFIALFFSACAPKQVLEKPDDAASTAGTQLPLIVTEQIETAGPAETAIPVQANPIFAPAQAGLTEEPESITALVNKYNHLATDYVPDDLVEVQIPFSFSEKHEKRMMRRDAAIQLEALVAAAATEGLSICGVSGYRSFATQASIFQYNVGRFGSEQEANRISARAGESEHQTGLAMDVSTATVGYSLSESFADTPEFAWLQENAHLFGFHIRYPLEKEDITGYMYEPWHLRYFGTDLAAALYEDGVTYEEFLYQRV